MSMRTSGAAPGDRAQSQEAPERGDDRHAVLADVSGPGLLRRVEGVLLRTGEAAVDRPLAAAEKPAPHRVDGGLLQRARCRPRCAGDRICEACLYRCEVQPVALRPGVADGRAPRLE